MCLISILLVFYNFRQLQCIKLKNKGWKHQFIADFLLINDQTVSNWLKTYETEGLKVLLDWNYSGKPSGLTLAHQKELQKRSQEKPFANASEAKKYIKETFGIDYHLHWVQKLIKKNFVCHTKKQD